MDLVEIKTMITLIEGEYERAQRNTPYKMAELIKKEFDQDVSPNTILKVLGVDEDYEKENWKIINGYDYY